MALLLKALDMYGTGRHPSSPCSHLIFRGSSVVTLMKAQGSRCDASEYEKILI